MNNDNEQRKEMLAHVDHALGILRVVRATIMPIKALRLPMDPETAANVDNAVGAALTCLEDAMRATVLRPESAPEVQAKPDRFAELKAALAALGHERPGLVLFRAQRVAGDIARAEDAGDEVEITLGYEADSFAQLLPDVWAWAKAGHAGGGGAPGRADYGRTEIRPEDLPPMPEGGSPSPTQDR